MSQPATFLRCSQATATFLFILLGLILLFAGCAQLYKTIGMSDAQVQEQVAADQQARGEIVNTIRTTSTDMISTALAGLGAIVSGFLAKWLGTERTITKALIQGVETTEGNRIKTEIKKKALSLGVENKLHKRVAKLT